MIVKDVRRYETDLIQYSPGGPGVEKESSVPGVGPSGGHSKEPARVRMEFPETWLWSDSVTGYLPS